MLREEEPAGSPSAVSVAAARVAKLEDLRKYLPQEESVYLWVAMVDVTAARCDGGMDYSRGEGTCVDFFPIGRLTRASVNLGITFDGACVAYIQNKPNCPQSYQVSAIVQDGPVRDGYQR